MKQLKAVKLKISRIQVGNDTEKGTIMFETTC